MTALLEFKQKLKGLYGQYEIYILPFLKFLVALIYFIWINLNMGYMSQINNVFIVLILALICAILPSQAMVFTGFAMMVAHCYALGIEVAAFMLCLILFMAILFLRFSGGKNIILSFTPLSLALNIPVLLPIGSGLLSTPISAFPAGCGVIVYFFVRYVRSQLNVLQSPDTEMMDKLTLLADGLAQNWEMWITVTAFVVVILLVNLIRTRSFDYAWRISIIVGGVTYVFVMLAGSFYFNVDINMISLIVFTVVSVLIGIVLEFFVFGGDYTRTERLEYEDGEYYYYVKAVPKAAVATSERSIKKINAEPVRQTKKSENAGAYTAPIFQKQEKKSQKKNRIEPELSAAPAEKPQIDDIDFEKKLEESLKDL